MAGDVYLWCVDTPPSFGAFCTMILHQVPSTWTNRVCIAGVQVSVTSRYLSVDRCGLDLVQSPSNVRAHDEPILHHPESPSMSPSITFKLSGTRSSVDQDQLTLVALCQLFPDAADFPLPLRPMMAHEWLIGPLGYRVSSVAAMAPSVKRSSAQFNRIRSYSCWRDLDSISEIRETLFLWLTLYQAHYVRSKERTEHGAKRVD